MKKTMTKLSVGLVLLSVLMFYPPQQAEAKFWGKDVAHSPSTSADGQCYDYQCTSVYRFWIRFDGPCEYVLVDSSGPCPASAY